MQKLDRFLCQPQFSWFEFCRIKELGLDVSKIRIQGFLIFTKATLSTWFCNFVNKNIRFILFYLYFNSPLILDFKLIYLKLHSWVSVYVFVSQRIAWSLFICNKTRTEDFGRRTLVWTEDFGLRTEDWGLLT